jgi:hypothetical protein
MLASALEYESRIASILPTSRRDSMNRDYVGRARDDVTDNQSSMDGNQSSMDGNQSSMLCSRSAAPMS